MIKLKLKPPKQKPSTRLEEQFLIQLRDENTIMTDINFIDDNHAVIKTPERDINATLVTLPTFIGTQKFLENHEGRTYHSAYISKMLIADELISKEDALHLHPTYKWPHGLTPPLHNVMKRKFKRKMKSLEYSEMCTIVDQLTARDKEASSVNIYFENTASSMATHDESEDEVEVDEFELTKDVELHIEEQQERDKTWKTTQLLRDQIEVKMKQLESVKNPIMKKRFQATIDTLEKELKDILGEKDDEVLETQHNVGG